MFFFDALKHVNVLFTHQDLKASIRAVKIAMSIEMCLGRNFRLCWVELIAYEGFLKLGYPQIIHFYMILQDFPLTILRAWGTSIYGTPICIHMPMKEGKL